MRWVAAVLLALALLVAAADASTLPTRVQPREAVVANYNLTSSMNTTGGVVVEGEVFVAAGDSVVVSGPLELAAGAVLTVFGDLGASGTMTLGPSSVLRTMNGSRLQLNELRVDNGATIDLTNGTMILVGTCVLNGVWDSGSSAVQFTDLTVGTEGMLRMDVSASNTITTPSITGTATLSGAVSLRFPSNVWFYPGDSITVLTAPAISGTFGFVHILYADFADSRSRHLLQADPVAAAANITCSSTACVATGVIYSGDIPDEIETSQHRFLFIGMMVTIGLLFVAGVCMAFFAVSQSRRNDAAMRYAVAVEEAEEMRIARDLLRLARKKESYKGAAADAQLDHDQDRLIDSEPGDLSDQSDDTSDDTTYTTTTSDS